MEAGRSLTVDTQESRQSDKHESRLLENSTLLKEVRLFLYSCLQLIREYHTTYGQQSAHPRV